MRPPASAFALLAAAILGVAMLCPSALPPVLAEPAWGLEQLMTDLGRERRSKATFVEVKHLKILKKPLEQSGTLEYREPDHLERRTLKPKPESFVVDGDRLTLENARGQRRSFALQDNVWVWAFVESIRSTLKGDLATLERFYDVGLEGDEAHWQLSLSPKEPRMREMVTIIHMNGSSGRIDTIEIREARGDWSVMTIQEDTR